MTGEATNCMPAHSATKTPLIQPADGVRAGEFLDQRREDRDDDAHRHDVEHRGDKDEGDGGLTAKTCGGKHEGGSVRSGALYVHQGAVTTLQN